MNRRLFSTVVGSILVAVALNGCSSLGTATSLYEQLGGMGEVTKLAGGMMNSLAKNPEMLSLLSNVDTGAATGKVANQLCSALGGDCAAPFSAKQISDAAGKLSPAQTDAVTNSFNSALKTVTDSPELTSAITKSLGSQLGGIVGAIL